jgi:ubiquinol-cytochrome c reductase cytochrome c1 subunit
MKKILCHGSLSLLLLFVSFFSLTVHAAELSIALEKAPIDRSDLDSVKRGARFFSSICISCHTLVYLQYNKLANEAGITYQRMPLNFKMPNGTHPPDLSLEANVRGVDWIYTYLHSFYVDASRPTGVNNLLVPNTVMPDMLAAFRGKQILATDHINLLFDAMPQWYDVLTLQQPGSMDPHDFDNTVADVVNFLAYASEPFYIKQHQIGWWVLGYLVIFFVFMYLLKRAYWKDVEKNKK